MDPSIMSLIVGGIGAMASLLGFIVSHLLLMQREREQWTRTRSLEQEKWFREKLYEIYTNCIYYVEHQSSSEYAEKSKWLNLLLVFGPEGEAFSRFHEKVEVGAVTAEDVVLLAASDPRLQGDSIKLVA